MRDAWRLAVGTFLALPVPPPARVDTTVAGRAMALAPVTAVPSAAVWVALGYCVAHGSLPPLVAAVLASCVAALMSRGMHLDGLADTADGLASGYDRAHALDVMRRGDTGPAGAAALVLVVLLQAAALASLMRSVPGVMLASLCLAASRLAPAVVCRRGVPAARREGLGAAVAGSVTRVAFASAVFGVGLVTVVASWLAEIPWYAAGLVPVAAVLSAWLVTRHAVRRLGGVTGDVIGAAIEISLAAALVVSSGF